MCRRRTLLWLLLNARSGNGHESLDLLADDDQIDASSLTFVPKKLEKREDDAYAEQ